MARFFFHVRDGADLTRDEEGQELTGVAAAALEAVNVGRELLGERLLHGGSSDPRQIEIADEHGNVVGLVQMSEILFQLKNYDSDVTKSAPTNAPRR